MLDTSGTRSAGHILSRVVRITLGDQTFELPVRSMRANREWKERLDAMSAALLAKVDTSDWAAILAAFDGHGSALVDLLVSYDSSGQLSRDLIEDIEPDATEDVVKAIIAIGRAANPLPAIADLTRQAMAQALTPSSSERTSTPPPPTAGSRRKSTTN